MATATAATWQDDIGRVQRLDEGADGFHRSWIMLFPVGAFAHPEYGKLSFTRERLTRIKRQFDERVRHIDIALDADHRASSGDSRATGWIEQLQLREGQPDGTPAGLWAEVRWTPYGMRLLSDQEYRYFSPDFGEYTDPQTGRVYKDVLNGGALTNRPFLKVMPAVRLSDSVSTRAWGAVDKSKLPDSAFLDQKNRRLPIYEGAGAVGADGRYTQRGKLNIHGLEAALAAIHGARSGTAMTGLPAGTEARIRRLLAKHGKGGESGTTGSGGKETGSGGTDTQMSADKENEQGATLERGASDETGAMLFMGTSGSTTSGSLAKAPLGAHEADDDMRTESLDDMGTDDGMQYDDGDGDGDGDGGEPEFDAESNTHGQMTTDGHAHGKFGKHSHDGDASHTDAPITRGKQMREPLSPKEQRLAEMVESYQQQLREVQFKLYEAEVEKSVARLSESLSAKGAGVSKVFRDAFQSLMLSEGFAMSEATRNKVVRVIDLALRRGMVDLSRKAQALSEMDAKATGPSVEVALPKDAPEGDRQLMEEAHRMALSEKLIQPGQNILAIDQAKRADLLLRAGRQIGSK